MKNKAADQARAAFKEEFSAAGAPEVAVAPGRVNLIGEHTDYNGGFVLPMAIDSNVAVAFSPRTDNLVRARSSFFGETREEALRDLSAPGGSEWFDYVAAVFWAMRDAGLSVGGLDMAIAGDVPVGAGLASSAALEMAVARASAHASGLEWDPVRMASICQHAENSYVGVSCGIMDQFAASVCAPDTALLLDCLTLEHQTVPIPAEAQFVVMDTGVRRSLATSEYNDRRSSCEAAVAILGRSNPNVRSLRDVDPSVLVEATSLNGTVRKRATHVVNEIGRPLKMAEALNARDLVAAGRLMDESHFSLRDLYEVSCYELDLITAMARDHSACYGARMTGAGFGGCAVALVLRERASAFVHDVTERYAAAVGVGGALYACEASAGAMIDSY